MLNKNHDYFRKRKTVILQYTKNFAANNFALYGQMYAV